VTGRVDSHHHVWDLATRDQPWISGAAMAPIARTFRIEELVGEAEANGITGSVVVQTVASTEETDELLELAAGTSFVLGVVGYVDLCAPDVGERLDQVGAGPSGQRLVGVRSLIQDEHDPDWVARPAVIAGLNAVADRGLTFDLLIRPYQLDAAVRAVRAVPDGRFVLDHLAKPPIASQSWEPWAGQLAELAASPNVSAKVSGLLTEADWSTWTVQDLQPYVAHALECFGPDRLMFGSDWPLCTLAASYTQVVDAMSLLLDGLTWDEQTAVFGGTARRAYSLDDRVKHGVH
jgi:L-fuconolactonase